MLPLIIGGAVAAGSIASNLYDNYKNRENARNAYNSIKENASNVNLQNSKDIANYEALVKNTYGEQANKYNETLENFLNSEVYQNDGFNYSNDVSDFYDPYANQRINAAMNAINNSSSSGGNRFSSDYINNIAAKQQALTSEEWEKAYNKLMTDRQRALNEWNANSSNAWNNYNALNEREKYAIDNYKTAQDNLMQGLGEATQANINNRLGTLQTMSNVATAKANSNQSNISGNVLNPINAFMSSYFGGN